MKLLNALESHAATAEPDAAALREGLALLDPFAPGHQVVRVD